MTIRVILDSSNTVVNVVAAENPVTKSVADQLIATWQSDLANWENSDKTTPRPELPNFWTIPVDHTIGSPGGNIGDIWNGTQYVTPPEPAPPKIVPTTISDRQFFQGLAVQNLITQQEALDAVKVGTIPAAMESFISTLSNNEQFAARMNLSGATQFNRNHSLVNAFGVAMGFTSDQLDDLWIFCSTL